MKRIAPLLLALTLVLCGIAESTCAEKRSKKRISMEELQNIHVSSIDELLPYLKMDSVKLTMKAGVYRITANDVKAGKFQQTLEVIEGNVYHPLLLFEGNNSSYDFTGVTIEVESAVVNSYPGKHSGVHELHTIGNHNVIKNLKLVDIGTESDAPRRGWLNVSMDGSYNLLDGVEVRSRGSHPYKYGEAFGKGRNYVIKHFKHSACLVRGDYNHVKNCRFIHHAYGHFLFMQGALGAVIEGCYIEGKMTSTDQILKEQGTGSLADNVNFKTVWGYRLPSGYTLCLGEDGIRTYTSGNTMVNGKRIQRRTTDITVKDCTVKHARGGVALTLGAGTRYVENCTLIGCQSGFSINSGGKIVNCRSDIAFGPAFEVNYEHNRNITAEITIMPYEGEQYAGNGSKCAAFIMGEGHNITLLRGEGFDPKGDLHISVGGDRRSIGSLEKDENFKASNITLRNETTLPVIINEGASQINLITNE